MPDNSKYRPDIDGLRAVAVIIVILFHLDINLFSGGFIGVDLFFVISGFLITRIIRDEVLQKDSFNFQNFYVRRAKRILPSLFFTLSITFIFAYLFFAPQHFQRFGGSMLHSILSISNFYFWNESGYFDPASEFKPLLHTWSLSVEEQFYIFWPVLLVFLIKRKPKYTLLFIITAGIISLSLNHFFSDRPSTIFFLTPFRVFEFSIGAIMVWVIRFQPKSGIILEILLLTGLILILSSVFKYTRALTFPSFNALLPCLGAALIIYSGTAKYTGKLLNNQLAIRIGLISYSFYLIHWPIIVFYKYWKFDPLTLMDKCHIFVFSIISAALMYHFIEQPFRHGLFIKKISHASVGFFFAIFAMLLIYPAANVYANNGWTWRFSNELIKQLNFKLDQFHNYVWDNFMKFNSVFKNDGRAKVLIIGDSQAGDFVNILSENGIAKEIDIATIPASAYCKGIFPVDEETYRTYLSTEEHDCRNKHEAIMKSNLLYQADTVVLASFWTDWSIHLISSTVEFLKSKGVRQVIVVGRKNQSINGVKLLAKYGLRGTLKNLHITRSKENDKINNTIKKLESDFLFIDLINLFCNETKCQSFTSDGHLIIYDSHHLTPHGAQFIGEKFLNEEWADSLKKIYRTK